MVALRHNAKPHGEKYLHAQQDKMGMHIQLGRGLLITAQTLCEGGMVTMV